MQNPTYAQFGEEATCALRADILAEQIQKRCPQGGRRWRRCLQCCAGIDSSLTDGDGLHLRISHSQDEREGQVEYAPAPAVISVIPSANARAPWPPLRATRSASAALSWTGSTIVARHYIEVPRVEARVRFATRVGEADQPAAGGACRWPRPTFANGWRRRGSGSGRGSRGRS